MQRKLLSVSDFAAQGPFSEGQIRWFIFTAETNGLAASAAVVRVGRRVYLDVDRFEAWIDAQNPARVAA